MESLPYYPANIYCFPRHLQRNTLRLPRPLQDVFKTYLQHVFLKRLQDVLQDVFKTFSRRLEDVFARGLAIISSRRLGRQKNVTPKTSWRRLEDVLSTSSPRRMFAECLHLLSSCTTEPETTTHFSGLWFLRWKPRHSHKWLGKYWLISCYTQWSESCRFTITRKWKFQWQKKITLS